MLFRSGALRKNGHVTELEVKPVLAEVSMEAMDTAGDAKSVQLWPHRHGTDAMFISLLTKSE